MQKSNPLTLTPNLSRFKPKGNKDEKSTTGYKLSDKEYLKNWYNTFPEVTPFESLSKIVLTNRAKGRHSSHKAAIKRQITLEHFWDLKTRLGIIFDDPKYSDLLAIPKIKQLARKSKATQADLAFLKFKYSFSKTELKLMRKGFSASVLDRILLSVLNSKDDHELSPFARISKMSKLNVAKKQLSKEYLNLRYGNTRGRTHYIEITAGFTQVPEKREYLGSWTDEKDLHRRVGVQTFPRIH